MSRQRFPPKIQIFKIDTKNMLYLDHFYNISLLHDKMPRKYKRKTTRRHVPEDVLKRAVDTVNSGQKVRAAAKDFNVCRMTLTRFMSKRQTEPESLIGYNTYRHETYCYPRYNGSGLGVSCYKTVRHVSWSNIGQVLYAAIQICHK